MTKRALPIRLVHKWRGYGPTLAEGMRLSLSGCTVIYNNIAEAIKSLRKGDTLLVCDPTYITAAIRAKVKRKGAKIHIIQ